MWCMCVCVWPGLFYDKMHDTSLRTYEPNFQMQNKYQISRKTKSELICISIQFFHRAKQLVALILPLGAIKLLQKKRVQRDGIIKRELLKPQTVKNIMEICIYVCFLYYSSFVSCQSFFIQSKKKSSNFLPLTQLSLIFTYSMATNTSHSSSQDQEHFSRISSCSDCKRILYFYADAAQSHLWFRLSKQLELQHLIITKIYIRSMTYSRNIQCHF